MTRIDNNQVLGVIARVHFAVPITDDDKVKNNQVGLYVDYRFSQIGNENYHGTHEHLVGEQVIKFLKDAGIVYGQYHVDQEQLVQLMDRPVLLRKLKGKKSDTFTNLTFEKFYYSDFHSDEFKEKRGSS